jgi:uncharacterized membrane protein
MSSVIGRVGFVCFAVAMLFFGAQYLISGHLLVGHPPIPSWPTAPSVVAYLTGAIVLAAALGLFVKRTAWRAAAALGGIFVACAVALHGYRLAGHLHDPLRWTSALEALSLAGGAFVVAFSLARRDDPTHAHGALLTAGRVLYAVPLFGFGIQHFMYASFIAMLIPSWIPFHLFWAYFIGAAFFAAGASILVGKLAPLAASLLGAMFFTWVVVLHLPRALAAPHHVDERTSLFVALAMCGAAWSLAGSRVER